MNSVKQLARELASIDWQQVQTDAPAENEKVNYLRDQLMQMDKQEAISLLLEVMEAAILNIQYPRTVFSELVQFTRMRQEYLSYKPVNGAAVMAAEGPWYQLCIKLNAMARYVDDKHFGLPLSRIDKLIDVVKHEFTLVKNEQK